ncbi:methyltransferase family protein [Kribbella sp. VKM Ac-2527]|uniref:Methyltransferase family protein n=1 Tax=Kribbella caucasensis TaxID=2512215 RepID=A0A4R6KG35_9ACTN|nr:methyltransferase domain-containing protein [Kribbella sp. VKM Ac-2527]TDO48399.1 methyltransferase family protein [Kribbella sp. VKM Ac-2527]
MTPPIVMTAADTWLGTLWPWVRSHLPAAPARVVEIGCGPRGGFVPMLNAAGYEAVGVDPEAPGEPGFHRTDFELYVVRRPVDAIIACTSLHHVADLDDVADRMAAALVPGGALIVVEWAVELFDEPTARWCFDRLSDVDDETNWLQRHREAWWNSGGPWDFYLGRWARENGIHTAKAIQHALDTRFQALQVTPEPYFFAELDGTTYTDEQAAIDTGEIRATGIRYVARYV